MHSSRSYIFGREIYPELLSKTLILSLIVTTSQLTPAPPGNPMVSPTPPPPSHWTCPDICTQEYAPLCGSDGKTYSNLCYLKAKNCRDSSTVTAKYPGECDSTHEEAATKRDFNLVLGGTAAFIILIIVIIFISVSALRRRQSQRNSPRQPAQNADTSVHFVPGMSECNAPVCMYQRPSRRSSQPPPLGFVVSPPKYEDIVRSSSERTRESSNLPPSYESVTRVSEAASAKDTSTC